MEGYKIDGKKLRLLRTGQGITQEQLAKEIGVSHDFIYCLESEMRSPSLKNLIKLCTFFKVPINYLHGEDKLLDEYLKVFKSVK